MFIMNYELVLKLESFHTKKKLVGDGSSHWGE